VLTVPAAANSKPCTSVQGLLYFRALYTGRIWRFAAAMRSYWFRGLFDWPSTSIGFSTRVVFSRSSGAQAELIQVDTPKRGKMNFMSTNQPISTMIHAYSPIRLIRRFCVILVITVAFRTRVIRTGFPLLMFGNGSEAIPRASPCRRKSSRRGVITYYVL
jgi:hypothetical protein